MEKTPFWADEGFWRKTAIYTTVIMLIILAVLTWQSLSATSVGTKRVPAYSVINKQIGYEFDAKRNALVPVIKGNAPLFGKELSEVEAEQLVTLGKKTTQAKNCIGCHTFLGNGSYYAPDLTKSWLDPYWKPIEDETETKTREEAMAAFLQNPGQYGSSGFGTGRRMPNLKITPEEAKGIVAYLKWMSSIDTNGFPANFKPAKEGE